MLSPFTAYKLYLAVKLHFTSKDYDIFKYNAKVSAKEETFNKRRDKIFFEILGSKFDVEKLIMYYASNLIYGNKNFIYDKVSAEEIYKKYVIYRDASSYKFKTEINDIINKFGNLDSVIYNQGIPKILHLDFVSRETIYLLNLIMGFKKEWEQNTLLLIANPDIFLLLDKMGGFVEYDEDNIKQVWEEIQENVLD